MTSTLYENHNRNSSLFPVTARDIKYGGQYNLRFFYFKHFSIWWIFKEIQGKFIHDFMH